MLLVACCAAVWALSASVREATEAWGFPRPVQEGCNIQGQSGWVWCITWSSTAAGWWICCCNDARLYQLGQQLSLTPATGTSIISPSRVLSSIQIVTGVEVVTDNFWLEVCKMLPEIKDWGNILQNEGNNFLMMIDMPVTVCFVIPQNQTVLQVNK